MAIRIQFAGDKSIGIGSRPPGAFSLFKPPGAAFPPAGSYNSTLYGETYPVAEGGTYFTDPTNGANPPIPNQICDVDVLNDGSGGTYIDWSSATNVQYEAYGVVFITHFSQPLNIEVPSGSFFYYQGGTFDNQYFHDGTGSWSSGGVNQSYYSNGTDTYIESVNGGDQQTEVPSGSGNYYSNGLFDGYTWDGSGGYNFPVTKGTYFPNGDETGLTGLDVLSQTEVPTGSGIYYYNGQNVGYTWDGSGGYNYPVTKVAYYSNGTDTNLTALDVPNQLEVPSGSGNYFNDGTSVGYTWDGTGGYNYPVTKGSFYANGVQITYVPTGNQQTSVEVPSGSGNYYSSEQEIDVYDWDGSGNYSSYTTWQYFPMGSFIYNDGTYDYYWDGNGGYYT